VMRVKPRLEFYTYDNSRELSRVTATIAATDRAGIDRAIGGV